MERATEAVPAFKEVLRKLDEQVTLRGQSQSTLHNYSRRIAQFVLHFHALPEDVDEDRINTYLATLARDPKAPSRSSFKHTHGLWPAVLLPPAGHEQKNHCPAFAPARYQAAGDPQPKRA